MRKDHHWSDSRTDRLWGNKACYNATMVLALTLEYSLTLHFKGCVQTGEQLQIDGLDGTLDSGLHFVEGCSVPALKTRHKTS